MNLRHILLDGAYNFRDLGGYPTLDKTYTAWGVFYRSDSLAKLSKKDWDILEKRRVKTIIDLRSKSEVESAPINMPKDIEYHNVSLMKDLDDTDSFSQFVLNKIDAKIVTSMILDYPSTVFGNLEGFAKVLKLLLDSIKRGSTVFICSAGKDRTGMVSSLILYFSNVLKEDIVVDYMVSNTYNTHGVNKEISSIPKEFINIVENLEALKDMYNSDPETILRLLKAFDEKDISKLLDEKGFTKKDQEKLKTLFTKPI